MALQGIGWSLFKRTDADARSRHWSTGKQGVVKDATSTYF